MIVASTALTFQVHLSGISHPDEVVLSNMGAMLDLVLLDMEVYGTY